MACNEKLTFFTSEQPKGLKLWSSQKVCDAVHYLFDNIFIRFGSKLYRHIVGIPMGTNCAPLIADMFLFVMRENLCCFFLTIIKQMLLKHLTLPDDISMTCLSNIDNSYFEQMVSQSFPLNLSYKANSSGTEAPFSDLRLVHYKSL